MTEASRNTPDLDYARQFRVGWARTEGDGSHSYRTPLDLDKIASANGELTDGVRAQLDRIVSSVESVKRHASSLPGYDDRHVAALNNGYVLAGENVSGKENGTEMRFASPEEFRAMVARAVGEKALAAYESALQTVEPGGEVQNPRQTELEELKQRLDEEDQLYLWRIWSYSSQKRHAQKKGDGQASIDFGNMAGEAERALSPEARAVKDRYIALLNRS